jgi:hypothetical protein
LDVDHRRRRAGPLWESGNVVSESSVVNLVDEDAEESGGFVAWVGFELGVDLDDERRGDCGEQTSLLP